MKKSIFYICIFILLGSQFNYAQTCVADAGDNLVVCDGEGSSHKVYLDGSRSSVTGGEINYEWTVLTIIADGLEISSSQSDEVDPYFKYPDEILSDTTFLIELRVFDDDEICENRDTMEVFCYANMCPTAYAGDDQTLSNGCDLTAMLDGTESEDPQDEEIMYQWSSLEGYDDNISESNSSTPTFTFPEVDTDRIFSFKLIVSDAIHEVSDTVRISYLNNDAPVADAGNDLETCEYSFYLNASQSYDVNWNELSYSWSSLDGLTLNGTSSKTPIVTSPTDLTEETTYRIVLDVNDGYCSSYDTVLITIQDNLCPIAFAGETVRVPKYDAQSVVLNASDSFDPEGDELSFEWTTPSGETVTDSVITVADQSPNGRYSNYVYKLKVMDSENAIAEDSVEVIFSRFSSPVSPAVYAVASHARVLVSWEATSENYPDSLTGYYDFEGYKLYRSTDNGESWGGEDEKLYDFNGDFVGWKPYAQFDYDEDEDFNQCIYDPDECEPEDTRQTHIYGLDPLAPRFSLGSDTGIEYFYVDSNVIDGVEYTYTVTAYDIGLSPFEVSYSEIDTSGIYEADTLWSSLNPGQFLGPDTLQYYNEAGQWIRDAANATRGFPSLESRRGNSSDQNFITVIPGYTALDISFPDADDIEALFTSNTNNIGTGIRDYFIVDRTKIVQDNIIYEIQADQGPLAVDGMACENPHVFGYVVTDTMGTPKATMTYYEENLNFYEKDSISGLPGTVIENGSYVVPVYDIVTKVGKWSDQFKGIRFKMENEIPLNTSLVPDVEIDTLIWGWTDPEMEPMDSLTMVELFFNVWPELSYTNIASYNRRLNFDYKIEFFDEPIGDTLEVGDGFMYTPFRITNMWTGKKVGLKCDDFGSLDAGPTDESNGARDLVWNRSEEIYLRRDSIRVAGELIETYNYNLDLSLWVPRDYSAQWWRTRSEYDHTKGYDQGDTIYYKQMLWVASIPTSAGENPLSIYNDVNDDGDRNNPWRLHYPWEGGEEMVISPKKLFVDGDKWFSDMTKLGEEVGIADTVCLDTIKVVPNPYKASSRFNETPDSRKIRFTHLPKKCQISIYTITGEIVTTFQHDEEFDGNEWWNLRTGNNQDGPEVAPGLYIFVIEFPEEQEYCTDSYDPSKKRRGSRMNDYYTNNKYDSKRFIEKTKFFMGKFAVIR